MATPRVDVVIGARTEQFGAGVKGVVSQLNNLGREFQIGPLGRLGEFLVNPLTAATAAASALVGMIARSVAYAERLEAIAARTGTTVTKAGAIARAEDITGAPKGTVEQVIAKLRQATGEALRGSTERQEAFSELGISMQRLAAASPVELFEQVIAKFEAGAYSAREYAAANKVLGESFERLLPFIQRGLGREMGKTGALDLTGSEVAAAEHAGSLWRRLTQGGSSLASRAGAAMLLRMEAQWQALRAFGIAGKGWLSGQPYRDEASERASDILADVYSARGSYMAGDLRGAQLRLQQAQQRRQLLGAMRSGNLTAFIGAEFGALSAAEQLRYLGDLQSGAVQSLNRQSPFEQESAVTALLKVMEDIRKLQAEAEKRLSSIDSSTARSAESLEGL